MQSLLLEPRDFVAAQLYESEDDVVQEALAISWLAAPTFASRLRSTAMQPIEDSHWPRLPPSPASALSA